VTGIEDIQPAVQRVVDSVATAVVGIGDRWGQGSGIVIGEGKVLTNAHNLRHREVTVTFQDGRTESAAASGVDEDGDLAVLSVETGDSSPLEWSSNGAPGVGAPVFALSNPGGRGLRVSFGIVSGVQRSFRGPRGRRIAGAVEHTAPLLPGSSGGPVVDPDGRLVGINTHRLGEGFYLAISADQALKQRIDALARGESPTRPRLGVGIVPPHMARRLRRAVGLPEADGLLVRFVEEGSAAERAGIQQGDLIVQAAGSPLSDPDDLHLALDGVEPGGSLELKVLRGAEERTISVSLSTD
jgi:serine protease Do